MVDDVLCADYAFQPDSNRGYNDVNAKEANMCSKILIAAVIACSLTMFGCAQPDEVNVGDESSSNMSAVEATDACFAGCMERPGATEERCAEACARIGGDTCLEGCVERGGDEADCQEICDERNASPSCYENCVADGGDEATCAEACRERDRLSSQESDSNSDIQALYDACVEAGGTPEECREQAATAANGSNDGDTSETGSSAQDAYDECIEAGGSEEDCRERAAAAAD